MWLNASCYNQNSVQNFPSHASIGSSRPTLRQLLLLWKQKRKAQCLMLITLWKQFISRKEWSCSPLTNSIWQRWRTFDNFRAPGMTALMFLTFPDVVQQPRFRKWQQSIGLINWNLIAFTSVFAWYCVIPGSNWKEQFGAMHTLAKQRISTLSSKRFQ